MQKYTLLLVNIFYIGNIGKLGNNAVKSILNALPNFFWVGK